MLRDVFYFGKKPNVHPREQFAENLQDARLKATTRDFWVINEFCDYRNFDWDFDFEFLPDEDVWAEDHNNVWPSQHQKDSGTWLCPKDHSDIIIYRNDVNPVRRKNEKNDNWVELDLINHDKFDFSWHPDPTDPPYIYKWGCKFYPPEYKHVLEYRVPGATQEKYMNVIAELLPEYGRWVAYDKVDTEHFDMSWRPSPLDPPFIYVWGNKWVDGKTQPTLEYHVPGAVDKKFVNDLVPLLADTDGFEFLENIDKSKFDFSWRPNPTSPPFIYAWGNQWNIPEDKISIQYAVEGATEYKYMEERTTRLPSRDNWIIPEGIDVTGFDFSWEPSPASPPYIYEFGTQWQKTGGPQYVVPGATEKKYIDVQKAKRLPSFEGWTIPDNIDSTGFDFSWHPDDTSPPYVYVFATQWAFSGGPVYTVDGATELKYIDDQVATAKKDMSNWVYDENEIDVESFDFSWHPYVEDQPYIYQFGTQWQKTGGPRYITPGADSSSPVKYVDTRILKAKRLPDHSKFNILNDYKIKNFDYSWHPDETEEPYVYLFGNNQYPSEEMPTIEYAVPNATAVKYIHYPIATLGEDRTNWVITQPIDEDKFDFSWKPNPNDPPYIYRWGNKYISGVYKATIEYVVHGATEIKYMTDDVDVLPEYDRWEIPSDVDTTEFDFTWRPDPLEPDQIYQFGTQHQKTGGPRYIVPGAETVKYIDSQHVKALPSTSNWKYDIFLDKDSFDFSWHPDATDPAYIYAWGNQWVKAEDNPFVEYVVEGATEYRYMDTPAKRLSCMDNWQIPDDIDPTGFDFSWQPNPNDPPYIYEFGTQHQKTGGPRYVVKGATDVKYIDFQHVTKLSNQAKFTVLNDYKIKEFDYSWHPDETEEPYIYVFGNNLYPAEECPTIEYRVDGATQVKYINSITAVLDVDMTNWIVPENVDVAGFDFSWVPNPNDPLYIYEFGTQWQKTGGPKYVVENATEHKYLDFQKVVAKSNRNGWSIPSNVDVTEFDFSWHPDATDPPYVYQFGTQWALTGGPVYTVDGATEIKYMDTLIAKALPDKTNWVYDETEIDVSAFDFSWHPYVEDQPYIYQFGTQWQKTGGPRYITPGADSSSPVKYIDTRILKATRLPKKDGTYWNSIYPISDFDYSWHPDDTEEPYVYIFGNNLYPAEECPTVEYAMPNAKQVKYVQLPIATLGEDRTNWVITQPIDEKTFDFTWRPNPKDPPYIYRWGNRYIAGVYKSTIDYVVHGATEIKYMHDNVDVLPEYDRWDIPKNIDTTGFDFTWRPDPLEPDQIYQFGTQWQKTGGPRYIVPGAETVKYMDFQKVTKLPEVSKNWTIPNNIDPEGFDFSWHPDDTEPAYIYIFATQWAFSGGPIYTVPGATETKYVDDQIAMALPDRTNWDYNPEEIDVESFDFSWHPYVEDQPYIYQFGTQHQKTGGPRYITPGADDESPVKYIDTRILKATRLPNKKVKNWNILHPIDDFDYSWHPDDTEEPYIYIFGNQWHSAEVMPTMEYTMPGAQAIKYVSTVVAKLAPCMDNWEVPKGLNVDNFDFSWRPEPEAPPYIHQFGTQWQKTGGPRYVAKNATSVNYVDIQTAIKLPNRVGWDVPPNVDVNDFDFSWHPDDTEPAYVYQFGTQWSITGGPRYTVPGGIEVKYVDSVIAKAIPDKTNWEYNENEIDVERFDFSWHPYVEDQPYIYQFGTQWQKTGGPRYITPGATAESPVKYIDPRILKATRLPNKEMFEVLNGYKIKNFDYSWHPDDTEPAYIYVFGNNLYPAEECPTVEYRVKNGSEVKFVTDIVAKLDRNLSNWEIPDNIEVKTFDFSWMPHPAAPPYIYQFGTKLDNNDGPKYITPNTNGEVVYLPRIEIEDIDDVEEPEEIVIGRYYIETSLEDLVNQHPNEVFWAMRKNIDYTNFDFEWRPGTVEVAWELEYVHVFGSTESELTHTYFVSAKHYLEGHRSFKYVEDIKLTESVLTELFVKPDIFYVDRGNSESSERFEALKARLGNTIQKTRYLNSWVDTINRCTNRATSELIWVLNSELDYTEFDFNYYPNPWQMKMVHVFGTQWSHWGTTFMVNRESFREDTKYIKIIEHLSNLNFVKENRAKATKCVHDIIVVDHGNKETTDVVSTLQNKAPDRTVSLVKYDTSYLNTIRDIIKRQPEKKEHFIWVCSSVCDYSNFDFSYICDPFARDNLHVFPSGKQKFGDTFFIDVNNAREVLSEIEALENFTKVNYNAAIRSERLPEPVIVIADDTHTSAIDKITDFPYATLITHDNINVPSVDVEPMNLWSSETKNIYMTSTGSSRIVAPKEIKDYVKKELYDYPYIKRAPKLAMSNPIDIVFLSNGEAGADENYEHLLKVTAGLPNRVVRVDGINGRVAAYHAAAEASETPWFFTVFAKLKVSPKFDFNWQPDRMQVPKHYIFHAKNPVNGLTYGHQAMIAYNKKLTLANEGRGLDFTLDNEHEVVPLISGTANYNTDAFSTWRTAFREVIKLRADCTDAARERLNVWLNKAEGDFAQFSIKGALDADEFYDEVDGDFEQLKLSYEWDWLRKKFDEM